MTLFLFADLHDYDQQERGLKSAFEQSLVDDSYYYLVADGQGQPETKALQLNTSEAQVFISRFLAADNSYVGTAAMRVGAPHFAAVSAESHSQAILWEYISASPFSSNLKSFNPTSFEIYCCAERLFVANPSVQSVIVPLDFVRRDDLGMDITYRKEVENVILERS